MIDTLKAILRPAYYGLLYWLSGNKVKVSLGNSRGLFTVRSKEEYQRARGFMGEKTVAAAFMRRITPGDSVWDVGANIGSYSIFAGVAAGPTGRVFAFEPEPNTAQRLRINCAINNLTNVRVREEGLSSKSGAVVLYFDDAPGSGKHKISFDPDMKPLLIRVVSGDELVQKNEIVAPNIIKIDVEGHELEVLSGMKTLLADRRLHTVLCEVHVSHLVERGSDTSAVQQALVLAGFDDFHRFERGGETQILAVRNG